MIAADPKRMVEFFDNDEFIYTNSIWLRFKTNLTLVVLKCNRNIVDSRHG